MWAAVKRRVIPPRRLRVRVLPGALTRRSQAALRVGDDLLQLPGDAFGDRGLHVDRRAANRDHDSHRPGGRPTRGLRSSHPAGHRLVCRAGGDSQRSDPGQVVPRAAGPHHRSRPALVAAIVVADSAEIHPSLGAGPHRGVEHARPAGRPSIAADTLLLGVANAAIAVDLVSLFVGSRRTAYDRVVGMFVSVTRSQGRPEHEREQ